MLKKIIILNLVFLVFGCSFLTKKEDSMKENPLVKEFYKNYNNWDIKQSQKVLDEIVRSKSIGKENINQLQKKLKDRVLHKEKLSIFINDFLNDIKNKNRDNLKAKISFSVKKIKILDGLENLDVKNYKFITGNPKLYKNSGKLLIAVNNLKYDEIYYFDVELVLKRGTWLVNGIEERR